MYRKLWVATIILWVVCLAACCGPQASNPQPYGDADDALFLEDEAHAWLLFRCYARPAAIELIFEQDPSWRTVETPEELAAWFRSADLPGAPSLWDLTILLDRVRSSLDPPYPADSWWVKHITIGFDDAYDELTQ